MPKHDHNAVRRDENGNLYLSFRCPECEAAGIFPSDDEKRAQLLQAEAVFQSEGKELADVLSEEAMPELLRLLGRSTR